jgi:hypothetical protein
MLLDALIGGDAAQFSVLSTQNWYYRLFNDEEVGGQGPARRAYV